MKFLEARSPDRLLVSIPIRQSTPGAETMGVTVEFDNGNLPAAVSHSGQSAVDTGNPGTGLVNIRSGRCFVTPLLCPEADF